MSTPRQSSFLALAFLTLSTPALAEMALDLPGAPDGTFQAAQVLSGLGCKGGNLSPELVWSGAPPETGSFIVTLYDPDAPTGSGFWHWSVFDIPATVTHVAEGAGSAGDTLPDGGVTARNDFSRNQYDGACPPKGATHRYVVTVYAMPVTRLPLDATASAAMVGFFANTGALARASQEITYGD